MPKHRDALIASALEASQMPTDGLPEVALLGRSNCGKSSLLNRLLRKPAAHVSATPGRTRRLNFYRMKGWYLVDLPGYGYADVPLAVKHRFGQAVETYLQRRQPLLAAVLIQDCRRDPQDEERQLVEWAAARNLLLVVAGNKVDRLRPSERPAREAALRSYYQPLGCGVVMTSARTGEGIDEVRARLGELGLQWEA